MKSILIAGSDPNFRYQLTQVLEPLREDYELCLVDTSKELRDLLETMEWDLLVLDLDARDDLALEGLARIAQLHACIPIVALGQDIAPDIAGYSERYPDLYFPCLSYLRKPVSDRRLLETVRVELCYSA